jgi:hypothetical protein
MLFARCLLEEGGLMWIKKMLSWHKSLSVLSILALVACAGGHDTYIDPNMDFGAVKTVAVMPFVSLTRDPVVAERVRDVFITRLLSTGAVYVVPVGEVARGVARGEIQNPGTPSPEEIVKLGGIIKAQAVITGTVREYGEVRSGTTSANIISLSLQMIETQTGKVVWTASSTKGGIKIWHRLFGGGGQPMNKITVEAVNDLINKLLK